MPQRSLKNDCDLRHPFHRQDFPQTIGNLEPLLQLRQRVAGLGRTDSQALREDRIKAHGQTRRDRLKFGIRQLPQAEVPGPRNDTLTFQREAPTQAFGLNRRRGFFPKEHPRVPHQSFKELAKASLVQIDNSRGFHRKQLTENTPEFLVMALDLKRPVRQSAQQNFLTIQDSPKARHQLSTLPGRLDLQRQHDLEGKRLSFIR